MTNVFEKLVKTLALAASGFAGFMTNYLPNSIFLDNVQDITQLYEGGYPVPVSDDIRKLNEAVMNDMKLTEEDKDQIRLYTTSSFDFFYAGSVWKKYSLGFEKAIIGIPANFNWECVDGKKRRNIILNTMLIDWSSESGRKLEEIFILSEKAKKYALAEHLFYIKNCEPLIKGGVTSLLLIFNFYYMDVIRNFKNLQKRPKRLSYGLFAMVCAFNFTLWLIAKDIYRCNLEEKADKAVAALGKDYVEGGLEFYENVLKRNVALRSLSEKEGGKSQYSLYGNKEMLFRQKNLPITARRDFFKTFAN